MSRTWSNEPRNIRTILTRELWTAPDRSAQFQARVCVFGGNLPRIGISRFWYNEEERRYLPSQRGHCYFPPQVLEPLAKAIPDLQAEAKRLEPEVRSTDGTLAFTLTDCTNKLSKANTLVCYSLSIC
jgi:hypothetical protein